MSESELDWAAALSDLYISAGAPTVRQVGAVAGVSHSTVHQMLRGTKLPSWRTASKVIIALGGEPDQFQQAWLDASAHWAESRARDEVDDVDHAAYLEVIAGRRQGADYEQGWMDGRRMVMVTELQEIRKLLTRVVELLEGK